MPTPAIKLRATLMILCALGLTACGPKKVRLSPLPAELTSCAEEPAAPQIPARDGAAGPLLEQIQQERDRLTLDYILNLRSWGGDCQAKVKGAAAWNRTVGG